jgi:hypothetical protein
MSSHCLFHSYSVLLVEKTRVPVENDGPAASLLQTLSHIVVSSIPRVEKQSPQKNTTNIWFVNQVSDADSWEPLIIWPCHILSGDLEIPGKT